MGSGTILREVIAAAELLESDWDVDADIWSVTSFNELTREAMDAERWNRLNPTAKKRVPHIAQTLAKTEGPFIAATDYMRNYADQIRKWVPGTYEILGTDGFGRSDTRAQLRKHFEVNSHYVVVAALAALADEGKVPAKKVSEAIKKYGINPDKPNPLSV